MSTEKTKISIIIPVLNEEQYIKNVLTSIETNAISECIREILVIDGGSTDSTVAVAQSLGATVISSERGRAKQMNLGAQLATGELLYFLHVDTVPPKGFDSQISAAFLNGNEAGCFRLQFDSNHPVLRFFAWCTRINHKLCRGGDQSLFISKKLFHKVGNFNAAYTIYEDNEFIGRIYKLADFTILPNTVKTSARRYQNKGVFTLQYHFGIVHLKHYLGAGPASLYSYYKQHIAM
jgi:rSAM/selenodomain-associated transferase 2